MASRRWLHIYAMSAYRAHIGVDWIIIRILVLINRISCFGVRLIRLACFVSTRDVLIFLCEANHLHRHVAAECELQF